MSATRWKIWGQYSLGKMNDLRTDGKWLILLSGWKWAWALPHRRRCVAVCSCFRLEKSNRTRFVLWQCPDSRESLHLDCDDNLRDRLVDSKYAIRLISPSFPVLPPLPRFHQIFFQCCLFCNSLQSNVGFRSQLSLRPSCSWAAWSGSLPLVSETDERARFLPVLLPWLHERGHSVNFSLDFYFLFLDPLSWYMEFCPSLRLKFSSFNCVECQLSGSNLPGVLLNLLWTSFSRPSGHPEYRRARDSRWKKEGNHVTQLVDAFPIFTSY